MSNPYGYCQHTKYQDSPPCIHDAYQQGYDDAEKLHEDCECYRIGICQIHGEVQWVMYDDLKFVPDSVALDAYHRGRNDATRAIAEVVHDTIVSKKFVAGGLSDLPDLLTAIYYAGGGEPSELEHADDCDSAIGCTCGTRTIAYPQEEQG